MAYASYFNDRRGDRAAILGQFVEKDHGHTFEFIERNSCDRCNFAYDFPHRIFVGHNGKWFESDETRVAKVMKTVAYVIVDEDENGPVVEKWQTKGHHLYQVESV